MASTVLQRNNKIEIIDRAAPRCMECSKPMAATRVDTTVSDSGIHSTKTYECSRCGSSELVWNERFWRTDSGQHALITAKAS
jgi:uncharacterized protein with PIN domain